MNRRLGFGVALAALAIAAGWVLPIVVATSLPLFLWRSRPLDSAIAEAESLIT